MEKIQAALGKARMARSQGPSKTAKPAFAPVPKRSTSADDAWNALPPLQLDARQLANHRVLSYENGKGAADIDMLRTRVLQQMRANGWRRLAITSPSAACGKSTISLNLAFSLQRQPDVRTLLLEIDLRRPSLNKILGGKSEMNFAQVLDGTRKFEESAVRFGTNLAIATNHTPWRDASELLSRTQTGAVLTELEEVYQPDLIIFDTPPMLVSDDMMSFTSQIDCALLVAGAESTTVREVDICERDLASQTNVMGVVLNKCRYMGPEYGYGDYT